MDRLIDTEELAKALGVSPRTVDTWRTAGEGPDYIKIGAQVRYRESDVEQWLSTVRVIQGNTAGRLKPGPSWADFVAKAVQPSDATVHRHNLWRVWNEYLAQHPDAREDTNGPQLESDLRPALKTHLTVTSARSGIYDGIRLTTYGQTLLTTAKHREWDLPDYVSSDDVGAGLAGERFAIGRRGTDNPTDAVIDFAQHPVLAIFGRGTGKTTTVHHLIREITDRRRNGDLKAVLAVHDPRSNLHPSATQLLDPAEDKYEHDFKPFDRWLRSIETIDDAPPECDTIYLIVDNLDWADDPALIRPFVNEIARRDPRLRVIFTYDRRNLDHNERSFDNQSLQLRAGLNLERMADLVNVLALGETDYSANSADKLIGSYNPDLALPPGAGYLHSPGDPVSSGYLQLAHP